MFLFRGYRTTAKPVDCPSCLAQVEVVLRRMVTGGEDPLMLMTAFIDALRPPARTSLADAREIWRAMLALLTRDLSYRTALGETVLRLFADREQRSLYTEGGMLPNTGFFSELRRMLTHKVLPEIPDEHDLKDCIHIIFPHPGDQEWADAIPLEDKAAFWTLLNESGRNSSESRVRITRQILDSVVILAHRIAAMGLEPELRRVIPRLKAGESPFLALADEASHFIAAYRAHTLTREEALQDERHLVVLLDQCRSFVRRAHLKAASRGTSMPLTFLIVRLTQHLDRLELLVKLVAVRFDPDLRNELLERWTTFLAEVMAGERQRNSLRMLFSTLLALLSLRVTENASRVGEHYIAKDRRELLGMWRTAAGGGFLIAFMALLKLCGTSQYHPVFVQGLLNSLIYAGGFTVIYLLHFTVATKQPAMTAATIAASVSQFRGRLRESDRLVELIVNAMRSQMAAIAGNVLVALPIAIAVGTAAALYLAPLLPVAKGNGLLKEIDPLAGPALLYAGVAGVWLFVAGLVSGCVDNMAAYSKTGERVARAPWLVRMVGRQRSERLGRYVDLHSGGLAGNIFFGCALGMTPAVGKAFGLPLDIRHIAFSSANLGYALTALHWNVDLATLLRSGLGVALIGVVNLAVSFTLALRVALRSRGVEPRQAFALLRPLFSILRKDPARLLYPKKEVMATQGKRVP